MSERTKLLIAFSASALLHVLAFLAMIIAAWMSPPDLVGKTSPRNVELTLVRVPAKKEAATLPKPIPAPERRVISSEGLQPSPEAATQPTFESDQNMRAASELPASGSAPLPSQAGKQRPFNEFENKQYSLGKVGEPGGQPAPSQSSQAQAAQSAQQAMQTAPALRTVTRSAESSILPKATQAQSPVLKVPNGTTAQQRTAAVNPAAGARSGYQRQTERTKIEGSISNRGRNAVNAIATPLGRYRKAVADAIGSRWYYYVNQRMDLITVGDVRIKFQVDQHGGVQNLSILSNTANETFANYCVQSITQAKVPPIPPDLVPKLDEGRLEIEYTFTIYPQ